MREQTPAPDLHYLFAPLKHARLDYMVQKAVEMGVRAAPAGHHAAHAGRPRQPGADASQRIEAAEQCGILAIPEIDAPLALGPLIETWQAREAKRRIVFCDEGEAGGDPLSTFAGLSPSPLAVLIGPEGGFSDEERQFLRAQPFVTPLPLGPRILRADTAAVAALALVQAALGDWRRGGRDAADGGHNPDKQPA